MIDGWRMEDGWMGGWADGEIGEKAELGVK